MWLFNLLNEVTEQKLQKILNASLKEGYLTPAVAVNGLSHSQGFLKFTEEFDSILNENETAVDLGTGGGLPGLVLSSLTNCKWIFVDRGKRRCEFLKWAINELDLMAKVTVIEEDAANFAHSDYRGKIKLVTARSFASPGITAECAAPLLSFGGYLVVSEPPNNENRWPSSGLDKLGLKKDVSWQYKDASFQALSLVTPPDNRFPRRFSRIENSPLF